MFYTLSDHRNDVIMFKTLLWKHSPAACGFMDPWWFHLSFEHFDVISMVDKSIDHGKLLLIC